jgi:D-alanine--poly(phosphoribitol) ligase subunit 1
VEQAHRNPRQALLERVLNFNDTDRPFPDRATIHQLFEEQAERRATDVAVICEDARQPAASLSVTYQELNRQANQLAHLLRDSGACPDQVVAIAADRSLSMIVGIMAILKAGAAYLPIALDNPAERTQYMLSDSGARILLLQHDGRERPRFDGQVIYLDSPETCEGNAGSPRTVSKARDLAYIIYTSGSTGRPKGVMVEHRSVVNRLNWMQRTYPLVKEDVILQKTPFYFDVSVWELFWWALYGARVCLLRPGGERNPLAIVEAIEKHRVSVMHFVPSMLNVFLEYLAGRRPAESSRVESVRRVFASGEALTPSHIKKFNESLFGHTSAVLTNLYGPTETTVDVTYFDCPKGADLDKVPIGKPIDNTKAFILRDGNLLDVGDVGELHISGVGVARGYVSNRALTDERFLSNPFLPGERMYNTGDLARWLPDGNIEYLGRKDHQIKIRGFRIELGEIESNIRDFPGIDDCVVVSRKYAESVVLIIAYFVVNTAIAVDDLKKHLRERLPGYMVPNHFVEIDEIPLSSTGKADRNALPELKLGSIKRYHGQS